MIFFAIGIHEYCHCKFADMAGDPTPAFYGRVTLNLFKHFDPIGTIMIAVSSLTGFGLGWGKPAPINPSKMRNPRWDTFIAVAAGPISNLLQATLYAICLRFAMIGGAITFDDVIHALLREQTSFAAAFLTLGVLINVSLFMFNLIPLGLLDGHWLVGLLMPEKQRFYWFKFNRSYGMFILIGIIFFAPEVLGNVMGPAIYRTFEILTGLHLFG